MLSEMLSYINLVTHKTLYDIQGFCFSSGDYRKIEPTVPGENLLKMQCHLVINIEIQN